MDTIRQIAGKLYPERDIEVIDPAPAVARHLLEVMDEKGIIRKDGFSITLHSSGDKEQLIKTYSNLL